MTDVACVPSGTTVDVGSNEGGAAESIQGGGNLTMSGVEPHIGELTLFGPETSNIGDLTLHGGLLNGDSISMSGNFDWDVASGGDSIVDVVNGITQSGGGSFTISGSGTATDGGGAISTNSPVSISNETGLGSSSKRRCQPERDDDGRRHVGRGGIHRCRHTDQCRRVRHDRQHHVSQFSDGDRCQQ